MTVRIGSLCSGFGGLEMGLLAMTCGQVAWHAENDPDASAILAHHWPDVLNHGDITAVDWAAVEPVDILTAGYPCGPFSLAGLRKGADDERHLWPFVAVAVGVLRPRWVFLENVAGHVTLGLGAVLGDLAALGYDATWGVVRASDAGAPHRRERLFILAATDTDSERGDGRGICGVSVGAGRPGEEPADRGGVAAHSGSAGLAVRRVEPDGHTSGRGVPDQPGGSPAAGQQERAVAGAERGDRERDPAEGVHHLGRSAGVLAWGPYGPAVARWAAVTGRSAPAPTEPGRTGKPRLSPAFVEWLMGLPAGHVTAVPGLTRAAQLKALGNGVVPQQAALAARTLSALAATEGAA